MYKDYVDSILNKFKYEADTGSNGGGEAGEQADKQEDTDDSEESDTSKDSEKKDKQERMFSRAELAAIVADESQKAVKEAMSEAEKLTGMNDAEKIAYEKEQLEAKVAEFERKENLSKMSETASDMLTEKGVTASKEVLGLVVSEDAETTSANVKAYLNAIELEREAIKADFEKRLGTKELLDGTGEASLSRGAQLAKQANEQNKPTQTDAWGK